MAIIPRIFVDRQQSLPGASPAGAAFDLDFEPDPQMVWIGCQLRHYGVRVFRVEGEIANPHSVVEQGLVGVAPWMDLAAAVGGVHKEVDGTVGDLGPILYGAAGPLFVAFGEGLPAGGSGNMVWSGLTGGTFDSPGFWFSFFGTSALD